MVGNLTFPPMSQIDITALETNFKTWRQDRAPEEKDSDAFEIYSIEQVLKDADLSDEEINYGRLGSGNDGGADAMFFFVNRMLMLDDTLVPESSMAVELVIIQAKNANGFGESAVQKLHHFSMDCFDWSKAVDELPHLNAKARNAIVKFREKYGEVLGKQHTIKISFHYTTRTDRTPDLNVEQRVADLKRYVRSQISAAEVDFEFWGCQKMLAAARSIPKEETVIEATQHFSTRDGSVVCLVNLNSFASFLSDENGHLKTSILEPNVRDYQGAGAVVNKQIRATLAETGSSNEFWWLNNGITILAEKCWNTGNKITIVKPEIVNGLQTSHEVFEAFRTDFQRKDNRNVLLRIIVSQEEKSRTSIIKATNSQTPVNPVSLRATDVIHFDIEDRLKLHGLYYDRRKGEYKRLKKPRAKIVSITSLAQAVISAFLQRPADARARPQTLLANAQHYDDIFNVTHGTDFFASCVLLDRQCAQLVSSRTDLASDAQTDIRFYVTTLAMSEVTKKSQPTSSDISKSLSIVVNPLPNDLLSAWVDRVMSIYVSLGETDKVAKGKEMQSLLIEQIRAKFPAAAQRKGAQS